MFPARLRGFVSLGFQSSTLAAAFLLMALTCTAQVQGSQPTQWDAHPEMHAKWKAWREGMKRTPFPKKKGCFHAAYPATEWTETTCGAPSQMHTSSAKNTLPEAVGNGDDYTAEVSGLLTSATGSFLIDSGFIPPTSPPTGYSLQINTNLFPTSACNGAADPSACSGWVQFVFDDSSSVLEIEDSLVNWGSTNCPYPINQNNYVISGTNIIVCWVNTPKVSVPEQPYANLPNLELSAQVSGDTNTAILSTGDGNIYATQQPGLFGTDLAQNWNSAEFNVFGNGGGDQVNFNSGTTFVVQTSVNNGTTNAPACMQTGTTAETNNLNLIGPCCSYGGASPNIQFMESNDPNASSWCGANGVQGNITSPAPTNSSSVSIWGSEYPTLTFTETLYDSAPGAVIYWQVSGCSGSTSGSNSVSSGGSFTLVNQTSYNCNPSGSMYAVAPGFLPSPTVPISF